MTASIGGYRLVRRLGDGARAEVFLGYPERDPDAVPVAVKVYRPGVPSPSIIAEGDALARAEGEHSVRLLDAATAPDGSPALILERLPAGSLARVLHERDELEAGEAITVLAPLAETLARLHRAGVAHGGLRPESVLFSAGGAPVLACYGAARTFEAGLGPVGLAGEPAVDGDVRAFARLARLVLERVPHDRGVQALIALIESQLEPDEALRRWGAALFGLAQPVPLDLQRAASGPPPGALRMPTADPVEPPPEPDRGLLHALALPAWVEQLLGRYQEPARAALARARAVTASVRPRVWVPAALVGVALVAALVLVPPGDSQAGSAAPVAASPSPSPARDLGATLPDDPVAATVALLAERDRCLRERSLLCLDGVGQQGSAALAADQRLVRELQAGAETPDPVLVTADQVEVVERLGDSALVALVDVPETAPAPLRLLQGGAGWRIRGYLER